MSKSNSIAFDIAFAEEDRTSPKHILPLWNVANPDLAALPDHDQVFARAIAGAPVVTGIILTQNAAQHSTPKASFSYVGEDPLPFVPAFNGAVSSLASFERAARGIGALNNDPDRDGILRRIPLLMRYPPLIKAGTVLDPFVLSVDIPPTLLEVGGVRNRFVHFHPGGRIVGAAHEPAGDARLARERRLHLADDRADLAFRVPTAVVDVVAAGHGTA